MDQVTQNQRNNQKMEGEEDTPNQPNNNNSYKMEQEEDTPNQPNNNLMDTSHTDANTNHKTDNCKDKERLPAALIIAAIFGSLGSSFTFGYDITVVNAPALYVQDFYNQTWLDRYVEPLGTDRSIILWSITVSIGSIGAMFGTVAVPPLVKVLGRRGTLLMNNSFTLVGALFMAAAERSSSFEMMIIGRFLLGLHCGIGGNTIPIFMAEISPIQHRGAFGQLIGVGCFMGIIVGQVLGLTELLGHLFNEQKIHFQETRWNFLFAFMAIPALLQLCVLPFVPESPRYLLIDKNDDAGAEQALRRYLGKEDVSQELKELQVERYRQASLQKVSVLKLMKSQAVRWQIISVIVIMSGRTLSGINVLFYYTNMILEDAGIDENLTTYFTISLGVTGLISSIVGGFLIDRLGRRILLLLYFGGMAVGLALLTVFLNIQDQASWIPFLSFSCIILANIPASIGAWAHYVVNTELFEQTYRPPALMIGGGLNWMCNFIVSMLFPFMQEALQTYVFLVFMVISSLCVVYIYFVLPETKNKTFVEISQIFKKINNISDSSPNKEFEPKPEGVANIP